MSPSDERVITGAAIGDDETRLAEDDVVARAGLDHEHGRTLADIVVVESVDAIVAAAGLDQHRDKLVVRAGRLVGVDLQLAVELDEDPDVLDVALEVGQLLDRHEVGLVAGGLND